MLNKKNIVIISIFTLTSFTVLIILTISIGVSLLKPLPKSGKIKTNKQISPKKTELELRSEIQRKEMELLRGKNKVNNKIDALIKNQHETFEKLKNQQIVP